jgi:outer membrane protein assembly factor BamB
VIDLGEGRWTAEEQPRRRGSSRTVGVLVAILALAALGGAQPPPPAALALVAAVPSRPQATIALSSDSLYVGHDVAQVSAYAVPGGGLRWRATLSAPADSLQWVDNVGILLVSSFDNAAGARRVSALDGRTGQRLWSDLLSAIVDFAPDRHLLVLAGTELKWIDSRTGRALWSRPLPVNADVSAAHVPDRPSAGQLLVTAVDGSAQLLAEDTGALLASGDLGSLVGNLVLVPGPSGGVPNPTAGRSTVATLGDTFLVQRRHNADAGSLTAFDLATLRRQWTVTGDLLGTPVRCDALLCLGSADGMRAIDPGSGTVRWRTSHWQYAVTVGNGRLVAFAVGQPGIGIGVLDARTGRTLADLRGWWPRVYLVAGQQALLGRPDPKQANAYWLGLLDVDRLTVRQLGLISNVDGQSCLANANVVVCQAPDRSLKVWRWRG